MKKIFFLTACFAISAMLLSACQVETKSSMVNAKRRLEQYIPPSEGGSANKSPYVDLSEGPKLRYNANFGPRDLNFDVKIVNPY